MNSVATVYKWKGFYRPLVKKEITVADPTLQKYTGTYMYENTIANILKREDGYYLYSNGTYMKMHFSSETDFFNTESPVEKKFTRDASGNVNGYSRITDGKLLPPVMKIMNIDTLKGAEDFFNNIGWNYYQQRV